jgi:hypothetical protein
MELIDPNFSMVSGNMTSNNYGGNIDNFKNIVTAVNAQLIKIDTSGNIGLSIAYIDASLAPFATNASIGIANFLHEASLGNDFVWNGTFLEVSIASISDAVTKEYVDASIAVFTTNVSVGLKFVNTDASIVALQTADKTFATNASVGLKFINSDASIGVRIRFIPGAGAGLRDASLAVYDMTAVDTSLYLKVAAGTFYQWKLTAGSLG